MEVQRNDVLLCLEALEAKESELLAWGDTGGFFSQSEVFAIIEQTVPDCDPEDIYVELLDRAMLFQVPHPEGLSVYRTRMGEAVHLYRNLRQWFLEKPVEQSKTLVSDFRFVRRTRSYPHREHPLDALVGEWENELPLTNKEQEALAKLMHPNQSFRLSGFQKRATERICRKWLIHKESQKTASGTIVCAGTGSGKTLAFYLPALTRLANEIIQKPTEQVRILAIYPRKELLKDQFMETWSQCRKLDPLMLKNAGRKISIGAYFGDTVTGLVNAKRRLSNNSNTGIPFDLLRCATPSCSGTMQWPKSCVNSDTEELHCSACGHKVSSDEVRITRDSQAKSPPDILFTTTEMLNQHLGNTSHNHLFGVGFMQQGPTLVLLDEVHTYGGNSGAQAGFLLRRWMQRANCRPHFVGLSATLTDAEKFFADLIGARPDQVELVESQSNEMIEEGAEYMLALRGDPVSKTALLSTSIQASMLTRRILDSSEGRSGGTWGTKTFAFTDDLDVKNRFYHGLSDAEGWRTSYRGARAVREPLASLRAPDTNRNKIKLGQNWQVAQDIGHSLSEDDRANVTETSSQSAGIDSRSDIVVATASLEVGYNDPEVGAVIQHKAPRDVASYLQRKGRAGRKREMRPWMLVVLSAFGRDRVAFQRYEDLISPEIKRQSLPFSNGHIQKMQAAMACLDWFSSKLGQVSIWSLLKPNKWAQANQALKRQELQQLVSKIIEGAHQKELETYLRFALQLTDEQLQHVLWGAPRSVMLEFLPALSRMLETDFAKFGLKWHGVNLNSRSPMPEFIPDALFNELNLASLNIGLLRGQEQEPRWESLPFYQGMREFAPGRISKRYGYNSDLESDWLVPSSFKPIANDVQYINFEMSEAFGSQLQPEVNLQLENGQTLAIYKPYDVLTRPLDYRLGLSPKSNAQIQWGVNFFSAENASLFRPPVGVWRKFIRDISFFTHQQMTPLEVTRFNLGSSAALRFKNGATANTEFKWTHNGQPVGIGSRNWVDGVRVRLEIGKQAVDQLLAEQYIQRGIRPVYFQHLVANLPNFQYDSFKANWIAECYLAALTSEMASGKHQSLQGVVEFLKTESGVQALQAVPQSLFQEDAEENGDTEQQLQYELRQMLADAELRLLISECADALILPIESLSGIEEWARKVLANSVAAVIQQTLCTLLPDADERSVVADTRWSGEKHEFLEVWLTESESGGVGVISELSEIYHSDPMRVLNIFIHSTQPGQYERIDFDLFNLLLELDKSPQLKEVFGELRSATDYKHRKAAGDQLFQQLQESGFILSHSFKTVLFSRVLRAGSSESSDKLIKDLLVRWRELEEKLGIECTLNSVSHALAVDDEKTGESSSVFRLMCQYQGLLWPRGNAIRQAELNYYNAFNSGTSHTERMLVAGLFAENIPEVTATGDSWLTQLHEKLRQTGTVHLMLTREQLADVAQLITTLNLEQFDHLGLLLHPRVAGLHWVQGNLALRIELAESLQ